MTRLSIQQIAAKVKAAHEARQQNQLEQYLAKLFGESAK